MKWKELYKIGITGSRKFPDLSRCVIFCEKYFRKKVDGELDNLVVITGNALGVDSAIEGLCARQGIKNLIVPARWLELERAAGPHRNRHIVDLSNEILAFWDGSSRGTGHCIRYAHKVDKPIRIFSKATLIKEVGDYIHDAPIIKVPYRTSSRDVHKIRSYVEEAELDEFFAEADEVVEKPKKKKFKWRNI